MALILLLESSSSICSVALARDGKVIACREEHEANKHAEKLSAFCEEVMQEAGIVPAQLNAVAVSGGPGSYTGLRIGTSTAKGYCFALDIPLIAIPTLEAMACGMRAVAAGTDLLCPMIDARRMEVYAEIFNASFQVISSVAPVVLDETSFSALLTSSRIWFSGDGMPKAKELLSRNANALFTTTGLQSARNMAMAAEDRFNKKQFEDLAYYVPFYLKTFQPGPKRSST